MQGDARRPISRAWVLLLFLALTVLLTWPLAARSWDTVPLFVEDQLTAAWIISWDLHALANGLPLFDANVLHPEKNALLNLDTLLFPALLLTPVLLATGNPIFALNLLVLGGLAFTGYAMFLLVEHLTGSRRAAILAGITFAFGTIMFAQLNHPYLLLAGLIPLSFKKLHEYLPLGERKHLLVLIAVLLAMALNSLYHLFFTLPLLAAYCAWRLVTIERTGRPAALKRVLLLCVLAAAVLLPVLVPYLSSHGAPDAFHQIDALNQLSADLGDYLTPFQGNRVYGALFSRFGRSDYAYWEHCLFPGLVPVLLALLALRGRGGERGFYLLVLAGSFVFSLGPYLKIFGNQTPWKLPLYWLYGAFPAIAAIRTWCRASILVMFSLSVLAGLAVRGLEQRGGRAGFAALAALLLVESFSVPLTVCPVPVGSAIPPVYRALARDHRADAMVELPMDHGLDRYAMYYSTVHWKKTVNANVSFLPDWYFRFMSVMNLDFPVPRSLDLLRFMKVGYVLVHWEKLDPGAAKRLKSALPHAKGLREIYRDGADSLYVVE